MEYKKCIYSSVILFPHCILLKLQVSASHNLPS
uniref:Uncharacterized protein n=1 Tax=Arundo donax TaxID=35708 RepID=A0A0A9GG31_ARUDO